MPAAAPIDTSEAHARSLDAADDLAHLRDRFHIPPSPADATQDSVYLVGNSLGCMPKRTTQLIEEELEDWKQLGVRGHLRSRRPWFSYHEQVREASARVVGAKPEEVVAMNTLTVNLQLMMTTFFRPEGKRTKIVIEDAAFPSDSYAVQSQLHLHGLPHTQHLIRLKPREGEAILRFDDVIDTLRTHADEIALVLLPGVNYLTGQLFDIQGITAAARALGLRIGWDLAHTAGNVPLKLHDWAPDFACWCTYKYMNAGPGSVAGCFVHERNARDTSLPRLAGWWGNDPDTRFQMKPDFVPVTTADAWALSNPPVLSLTPLIASLEVFGEVGMDRLRTKSVQLTGYMAQLIEESLAGKVRLWTPTDPDQRGCQLSLVIDGDGRALNEKLTASGVICDFREPNVIRAAPTPCYNTFHDVWRFVQILRDTLGGSA